MKNRVWSLDRPSRQIHAMAKTTFPIVLEFAKQYYPLVKSEACKYFRHRLRYSGLHQLGTNYISFREPTLPIVLIHETLHYLSDKSLRDSYVMGFEFYSLNKKRDKWLEYGSDHLNEGITERMALQIAEKAEMDNGSFDDEFLKIMPKRLKKERYRCARRIIERLFAKISHHLSMNATEVERIFYHAYFSNDLRKTQEITDATFGKNGLRRIMNETSINKLLAIVS